MIYINKNKIFNKKTLQLLIIIAIFFFVSLIFYCFDFKTSLLNLIESESNLGIFIYFAICIITPLTVPLPEFAVIVSGSAVFGQITSYIVGLSGIVLGVSVFFLLVRKFKDRAFNHLKNKDYLDKYNSLVGENETFFLALLFLIPVLPDGVVCMGAGLSEIKFKKYFLIALISKAFTVFIYSTALDYVKIFLDLNIVLQMLVLIIVTMIYFAIKKMVYKLTNK